MFFRIFVCFYMFFIVFHIVLFSRQRFSLQLYFCWFHPLCSVSIVLPTVASWLHWHFLNFFAAFKVTAYLVLYITTDEDCRQQLKRLVQIIFLTSVILNS